MAESEVNGAIDTGKIMFGKSRVGGREFDGRKTSTAKKEDKAELEILAVRTDHSFLGLVRNCLWRAMREARMLDIELQQMKQSELFRERMLGSVA